MDETIAPSAYRTGRGDRAIPLTLAVGAAASAVATAALAGPFLWPWGAGAALGCAAAAAAAAVRWRQGKISARWDEASGVLEVRGPRGPVKLAAAELTAVRVLPSAGRTELRAGGVRAVLPHRLVRVDRLIDRLRALRPDLFPGPGDRLRLRTAASDALVLAAAVGAAGAAGWLLAAWRPWVGLLFALGAAGGLGRLLFGAPRSFTVEDGVLTVGKLLGRRTWRGSPTAIREDAYAAGGAVFFRMRLSYGRRTIVLDEGHLTTPLRPHAGWIVHRLAGGPRSALY